MPTIDLLVAEADFALGLKETEFWVFIGSLSILCITAALIVLFCYQSVTNYSAKVIANKRAKVERSETEVTLIYLK